MTVENSMTVEESSVIVKSSTTAESGTSTTVESGTSTIMESSTTVESSIPVESSTKVILVMGTTGAGKSYLIKEISSNKDVVVGGGLESCTQKVQQVDCKIGDQSVMILDTPGFDDTERSDGEILEDIASYLELIYSHGYRIYGIIYLHNITETRMRGTSLKNLEIFAKLCGKETYKNVVMLSGRWNSVENDIAENREMELKENFWKIFLEGGCKTDQYRDKSDLTRIFDEILQKSPVVLDIQKEMIDDKLSLAETAAGQFLSLEQENQKKKIQADLKEINAEYNYQDEQMKAEMDKERSKLQHELDRIETEKTMMNDRRLDDNDLTADIQEQMRQARQDDLANRLEIEKLIKMEKDDNAREMVRLHSLKNRVDLMRNQKEAKRGRLYNSVAKGISQITKFQPVTSSLLVIEKLTASFRKKEEIQQAAAPNLDTPP
ncbi:hypothetical protein BGZ76_004005, partial [Entomortierella beljakovae]